MNLKRYLAKRGMKHEDELMEEQRKQKVKRQQEIPLIVGWSRLSNYSCFSS